ncbi:MAG TPA: alkaline phosphatase family protein [Terriglobia bacterium]|nr:alkaline phosphatase family protein [Terriglobia bacterium]
MNQPRRIRVFVLIDALGWSFLEGRDFLSDLLTYRTPLRTVLGFSSGAIPTILTGLPPSRNGHWNLFYYDPERSPFRWLRSFHFLPNAIMNHRIMRKLLTETGRHLLGLGRNFDCCVSPRLLPWFNWVEKRSVYEVGGISGAPSIFDQLAERGIPFRVYSYHHWTDREILNLAQRDIVESNAGFFFVYLSEMDLLLHNHWRNPSTLDERLRWYESRLRDLFRRARELDSNATMSVFSDHGMTPVEHHFDLVKEVEGLGFRMPSDYLAVYDSTMARFWFFNDRARSATLERLATLPCGRVIPDDEQEQLGIRFPDRRYGEAIFLMHPRWMMASSDFNGRGWMPAGMHGYHPDDPYSDAIYLSSQPPSFPVRTIADVYQCMREGVL